MHINHSHLTVYDGTEIVKVTPVMRTLANPNAPAAISKGTWAVKRCSNEILQYLAGVPANAGCLAYVFMQNLVLEIELTVMHVKGQHRLI